MTTTLQSKQFQLFGSLFLLIAVGLIVLFSASYPRANVLFGDSFYFVRRQLIWISIGVLAGIGLQLIPLSVLRRISPFLMGLSILALCLPLIPGIGVSVLGARRWISIFSYTLQPSEFVRLPLIFYLAHMLSKKKEQMDDFYNTVLPLLCVIFAVSAIIYLQNDFSSAVFIMFVSFSILFVGGLRLRYILACMVSSIPLIVVFLFTHEYRVRRLLAYFFPEMDVSGTGFQAYIAKDAIARGGLFGLGIGQSVSKQGVLPEAHSDFLAAILFEEMGLFGLLGLITLFALFAYLGYTISMGARTDFIALSAFGITTFIVLQTLVNLAVVCNLLPTTGLPLPFFSAGGSSIVNSIMLGAMLIKLSLASNGEGIENHA